MKKSTTGFGSKPSKITAIVVAMMLSGAGFAQTAAPTSPTAPTVPTMITVSPNAATALQDANTNSIFIDQNGINPTVNMTQIGSGNKMGTSSNPVYLRGDNQNIVGIQSGNNNTISTLQVVNGTGSVGATVTIQQIGNSNTADVMCGDSTSGCDRANINYRFTGNSNTMIFRGQGSDITSQIDVSGKGNAFNIAVDGNKHSQIVSVAGDYNIFNLTQNSTGANGSSIAIAQTGTGTTYNVQQSGSVDNVLNIRSTANGGSFNVLQRN
jgi:hypothetical protein